MSDDMGLSGEGVVAIAGGLGMVGVATAGGLGLVGVATSGGLGLVGVAVAPLQLSPSGSCDADEWSCDAGGEWSCVSHVAWWRLEVELAVGEVWIWVVQRESSSSFLQRRGVACTCMYMLRHSACTCMSRHSACTCMYMLRHKPVLLH